MATIQDVSVRQILGFRGKDTIEVRMRDSEQRIATCKIPFGVSEGKYEAIYCSPSEAITRAQNEITPLVKGTSLGNQKDFDSKLIEYDGTPQKKKLGGNLMLGSSIAYARLSSTNQGIALHDYIAALADNHDGYRVPRILCNIVEGGAHAQNDLEFQEHLIIPQSVSIREGITMIKHYSALLWDEMEKMKKPFVFGDEGGLASSFGTEESLMRLLDQVRVRAEDVFDFGIDAAANNVSAFEPKAYGVRYEKLVEAYPIVYLEDPFPEEGYESYYRALYERIGEKVSLVGDDLVVTNPLRIKQFIGTRTINGIIVKPDQVGTLTEAIASVRLAKENNWKIAVSHRAQETIDDYLADIAVGVGADFVKFGYFYQGERLAKYNRLLEIEESVRMIGKDLQ
ncbi:MAG: Enolase B [Parcubacteria group bacterium GW2011_GWA1_45_7]|nr:MAG: Enolase B [Parcubacteria group bacterium GW2011_GWA1_45_7]